MKMLLLQCLFHIVSDAERLNATVGQECLITGSSQYYLVAPC